MAGCVSVQRVGVPAPSQSPDDLGGQLVVDVRAEVKSTVVEARPTDRDRARSEVDPV